MKKLLYKLQRFLRDKVGLVTREDYFIAVLMIMFSGGLILSFLVTIYTIVSILGGVIETIVIIALSLGLVFVIGIVAWIIAYIFGWGDA